MIDLKLFLHCSFFLFVSDQKPRCFPVVPLSIVNLPGIDYCSQISVVTPDKLWVFQEGKLEQVDSSGNTIRTLEKKYSFPSCCTFFTISLNGDLIFITKLSETPSRKYGIHKLARNGNVTILFTFTTDKLPSCIHCSRINGHQSYQLLIGLQYCPRSTCRGLLMRFGRKGRKIKEIEFDENGRELFIFPYFITENKVNGDIIVLDMDKEALVVLDKLERHRFDYKGRTTDESFVPLSVDTDLLGHILVLHSKSYRGNDDFFISLLDRDGNFLIRLLEEVDPEYLGALCVDDKNNIYVAYKEKIKVFR